MIVNGDSVLFKKLVSEYNDCVKKYNEYIDSIYSELNKISTAWVSDSSVIYMDKVRNSKIKYKNFGETLSKFGGVLQNVADNFESSINSSSK